MTDVVDSNSVVHAQSLSIPVECQALRLLGYASSGDGGGALYRRAPTQPSHAGKLRTTDRFLPNGSTSASDGGWWEIAEPVLTIDMFGDPANAELATKLSSALVAAQGRRVVVPPRDFTLGSTVSVSGISVDVLAVGARIIQTFSGTGFSIAGGWEGVQAVSSISGDTVSVSDTSAYLPGDVIKIVSDDIAWGSRPGLSGDRNFRKGEAAVVRSVSGGSIQLDRVVFDTYTANVRIGRMKRLKVRIEDGDWSTEAGHDTDYGFVTLTICIQAIPYPVLSKFKARKGYGRCINLMGCFSSLVDSPEISGLINDEPHARYGYGIDDQSSEGTVVTPGARFGRVRHGYTTSHEPITPNHADLHRYGETANAWVSGKGVGEAQSHFDTHHGSRGITFAGVESVGSHESNGSITVRGRGHRIINPIIRDGANGIYLFTEDDVSHKTTDIMIISPDIECAGTPIFCRNGALTGVGNVTIMGGGRFRTSTLQAANISCDKFTFIGDFDIIVGDAASPNGNAVIRVAYGDVHLKGSLSVDAGAAVNSALAQPGFFFPSGSGSLKGGRVTFIGAAGITVLASRGGSGGFFNPDECFYQAVALPATGVAGARVKFADFDWSIPSYNEVTITTNSQGLTLSSFADHVVTQMTTGGTYSLGTLPVGKFVGQKWTLALVATNYGGIRILGPGQSTLRTKPPAFQDLILRDGDSHTFVWDGTYWRTVQGALVSDERVVSYPSGTTSISISAGSPLVTVLDSPLIAESECALQDTTANGGEERTFVRTSNATGAFDWKIRASSTEIARMAAAGQWVQIKKNNALGIWRMIARGSL